MKLIYMSLFWQESEGNCRQNANECGDMVPLDLYAQEHNGEPRKNAQCDDFLDDFQLWRRIHGIAPPVCRDLKTILKKCDAPARQDYEPQRLGLVFQMAVPRERHEDVRAGQHHNRQPAGLGQVVHDFYSSKTLKIRQRADVL
jgi:hypothetical protein